MVREQYAGKAVPAERVVVAAHKKGVGVVVFVVGEQAKADGAVKVLGLPRRVERRGGRGHTLVDHALLLVLNSHHLAFWPYCSCNFFWCVKSMPVVAINVGEADGAVKSPWPPTSC